MKKIITYILLTVFILSCSNSNDNDDLLLPEGTKLTAKINGQSFAAQDDTTSVGFSQSSNLAVLFLIGSQVDQNSSTFATGAISLAFTIELDATLEASSQWYTNSDDVIVIGGYVFSDNPLNDEDPDISATSEDTNNSDARIRITQLDRTAKTISGEFEFTAFDENTGSTYTITEGRFNQIEYQTN